MQAAYSGAPSRLHTVLAAAMFAAALGNMSRKVFPFSLEVTAPAALDAEGNA